VKRWKAKLRENLNRLGQSNGRPRVAILGVGQELRGDDALGLVAVRRMAQALPNPAELLLIEAGPVPENFCDPLVRFQPDLVLVIDAASMGQAPGTIAWIEAHQAGGCGFSTHSLPLELWLAYLAAEAGCETAILGIQPLDLALGAPLSRVASRAVTALVRGLTAALRQAWLPADLVETVSIKLEAEGQA
jgi:hydrogenase 3 maturation protease